MKIFVKGLVSCLLLTAMGSGLQAQTNWYRQSPTAFWAFSALDELIDLAEPDYPLLEAAVFFATNEARGHEGLPPLAFDPALSRMARQHSAAMAHYDFVGHTNNRQLRYRTMINRARQAQARVNAENVASTFLYQYPSDAQYYVQARPEAAGYDFVLVGQALPIPRHSYASFARQLVQQWMNSPGHRSNILHPELKRLACGVRLRAGADVAAEVPQAYSTQNFGM